MTRLFEIKNCNMCPNLHHEYDTVNEEDIIQCHYNKEFRTLPLDDYNFLKKVSPDCPLPKKDDDKRMMLKDLEEIIEYITMESTGGYDWEDIRDYCIECNKKYDLGFKKDTLTIDEVINSLENRIIGE